MDNKDLMDAITGISLRIETCEDQELKEILKAHLAKLLNVQEIRSVIVSKENDKESGIIERHKKEIHDKLCGPDCGCTEKQ